MATANSTASNYSQVVAIVGASSSFGARMLTHLEAERPDCWMVSIAHRPLRWPVQRVSSYRLVPNRVQGTLTLADIPDVMQDKAWDMFSERHELTLAEMPDVLQLENVDAVIHVGSHYDGPDPEALIRRTPRWVEAARIAGVRQFVYLSDIRVYGVGSPHPIPITEQAGAIPDSRHDYLIEAEPDLPPPDGPPVPPQFGVEDPNAMRIAILRTAISVGPGSGSPVADELLIPAIKSSKKRDFPLQLLHQHDLARAVEAAVTHQLNGIYNVVGDGVVSSRDVLDMCQDARCLRNGAAGRNGRSAGGKLSKNPLIVSSTKFKQAAAFKFNYSSARAARVFCHSVLLEPG